MGRYRSNANKRGGVVRNATIVERQLDGALESIAAMVGGVCHCIRQDGREGVDPPKLVVGDLHQDWEEPLSQIKRRLSSVGFPLMGGKLSPASLNRRVIVLGVMALLVF